MRYFLIIMFTVLFISAKAQKGIVYIKDSTRYNSSFIKGLKDYPEPIQLIDTFLIVGNDTISFPQDLVLNTSTVFKANKNHQTYLLKLNRTNETTIKYEFHLQAGNKKYVHHEVGEIFLSPTFFLGVETDEDDITNEAYGSFEYCKEDKKWSFCVRVGIGKDDKGRKRAIVRFTFQDVSQNGSNITRYCPVLRTE